MPTTIDDNFQGIGKAVTDDANATISNLLLDPVTGRLLVTIYYENITEASQSTKIDANYEGVAMCVTDDASADIKPLKVHPTSGGVMVDILEA